MSQRRILDWTPGEDFKCVESPLILLRFRPQLRLDIALFLCSIPTHLPQASDPTLNFDLLAQRCPGWSSLGGGEHRPLPGLPPARRQQPRATSIAYSYGLWY